MKTVLNYIQKASEIIEYCNNNKDNVLVMPIPRRDEIHVPVKDRKNASGRVIEINEEAIVSLEDHLFGEKRITALDLFEIANTLLNDNVDEMKDTERIDEQGIAKGYIKEFMDYMDNELVPKYEAYLTTENKYKSIYLIQFDTKMYDISYKRHVQIVNDNLPEDHSIMQYRGLDTIDRRIKSLNKMYFDKPSLCIEHDEILKVQMWSLEKDIDKTIRIVQEYVDSKIKDMFENLNFYYNGYEI